MSKKNNELRGDAKLFIECCADLKQPVAELSKKYPINMIHSALMEVGLRMSVLSIGNENTMAIFETIMSNLGGFGALIQEDTRAMRERGEDEIDAIENWEYNVNISKTIH
tara:strand:- start:10439 stop:10768 length:330 start_codon:yes stop_codon:yes gene_type:complete